MHIIDISWPIYKNMTTYKNNQLINLAPHKIFERDKVREFNLSFHNHLGTHVDGQQHFLPEGQLIDQLDLYKIVGDCRVLDLQWVEEKITLGELEKFNIQKDEIILLKTKNSLLPDQGLFEPNFVYLDENGAAYLADKHIKAIGIDYLGIERNQLDHGTHKLLLKKNIPIIEGLRLAQVKPSTYFLCCLPLKIEGIDSAPARAILIKW